MDTQETAVTTRQVTGILVPVTDTKNMIALKMQVNQMIKDNLKEGRDYGRIPGVDKDCLFQPGAEQVNAWFGVRPTFQIVEKEVDHNLPIDWVKIKWMEREKPDDDTCATMKAEGTGRFRKDDKGKWHWLEKNEEHGVSLGIYRYVIECTLIRRDTGEIVGQAIGSASTLESKYSDRPRECENTVLQMAEKRAFVRVTRNTYGLSDRFTDIDVPDMGSDDPKPEGNQDPPPAPPMPQEAPPQKAPEAKQEPPKQQNRPGDDTADLRKQIEECCNRLHKAGYEHPDYVTSTPAKILEGITANKQTGWTGWRSFKSISVGQLPRTLGQVRNVEDAWSGVSG